ncbi:hypothetical protein MYP_683 [Sporocytophaga myxococcoides]|uniref:Uncharacterized protein n=1 Tax=Sporocytophaga myxococcoides TaxID=153721 RepID=A0A098L985_9BACT|nr:hypothetical protein [Sporocytophaga myxococcoides]GAL83456.1 hypothetical protein MYP_683 [Sporocytophaga myxococcoides]
MTEIKIAKTKNYLFSLENLILAIVILYMLNNLDHLTKVYYDIGKRHLEEIFHIKNLDWYKSILVIIVLDLSIVVWIHLKRWPEAVIFQVLMFLINLLYYEWPGAFSEDFNRRAAELIFTLMFGYGVSSFAFLHSTRFKSKDQLKEDAELMSRLKSDLEESENMVQILSSEKYKSELWVNQLQSDLENTQSMRNQLQSKLNQAEFALNELDSKNIQAEKKLNELNSELIQVKSDYIQVSTELNSIQSNKIQDESKVKHLQSELNREKSHREKANEVINELIQYKQKWEDACRCKHCKEIKDSPNSARVHSGSCPHNPKSIEAHI